MKDDIRLLKNLVDFSVYSRAELAKKIGSEVGNLSSALNGRRPLPEKHRLALYQILGIAPSSSFQLSADTYHFWILQKPSQKDEMVFTIKSLLGESQKFGPVITVEPDTSRFKEVFPIMVIWGTNGIYLFLQYDYLTINMTDVLFEVGTAEWAQDGDSNDPVGGPGDIKIDLSLYNKIRSKKLSPKEALAFVDDYPREWTWTHVIFYASANDIEPIDVAKMLNLIKPGEENCGPPRSSPGEKMI